MPSGRFLQVLVIASFSNFLLQSRPLEAQTNAPEIKVYFSPHGGCTEAVVKAIHAAKKQILVEAYAFTSEPIAVALVEAEKAGVDVEVILDKSQEGARGTEADLIALNGIPTFIDSAYHIAHDKVMIIDGSGVITGSFNFTRAAEEYNAENLLVISNDPPLADQYTASWKAHLAKSHPFHPGKSHHRKGSHSHYWQPLTQASVSRTHGEIYPPCFISGTFSTSDHLAACRHSSRIPCSHAEQCADAEQT